MRQGRIHYLESACLSPRPHEHQRASAIARSAHIRGLREALGNTRERKTRHVEPTTSLLAFALGEQQYAIPFTDRCDQPTCIRELNRRSDRATGLVERKTAPRSEAFETASAQHRFGGD